MVSIITISHGDMAAGILSSAAMICPEMKQIVSLFVIPETNPDDFQRTLQAKIEEVDTGDGVLILADLLGGTPCNRAIYCMNDKVHLLAGMNLSMLITAVAVREDNLPPKELVRQVIEGTHNGVAYVNEMLKQEEVSTL